MEEGLRIFSTNPAHFYKLKQKGKIQVGKDADLLLFDQNYNITDFFVLGKRMIAQGELITKGTFFPDSDA